MSFLQLVIYTGRLFSLAIDVMRKKNLMSTVKTLSWREWIFKSKWNDFPAGQETSFRFVRLPFPRIEMHSLNRMFNRLSFWRLRSVSSYTYINAVLYMVLQLVNDIGPTAGTIVPESLFAFNRRNLRVIGIRRDVAVNTVFLGQDAAWAALSILDVGLFR
jgi:hypothetical protein